MGFERDEEDEHEESSCGMDEFFSEFEKLVDSYQAAKWAEKKKAREPKKDKEEEPEDEDIEKYLSAIKDEE